MLLVFLTDRKVQWPRSLSPLKTIQAGTPIALKITRNALVIITKTVMSFAMQVTKLTSWLSCANDTSCCFVGVSEAILLEIRTLFFCRRSLGPLHCGILRVPGLPCPTRASLRGACGLRSLHSYVRTLLSACPILLSLAVTREYFAIVQVLPADPRAPVHLSACIFVDSGACVLPNDW